MYQYQNNTCIPMDTESKQQQVTRVKYLLVKCSSVGYVWFYADSDIQKKVISGINYVSFFTRDIMK